MTVNDSASQILVQSLRSAWAAGKTPSALVQLICDYYGKPADALQFQTISLMKIAFGLSLSEARTVLEAPVFSYRPIQELSEFDVRFGRMLPPVGSSSLASKGNSTAPATSVENARSGSVSGKTVEIIANHGRALGKLRRPAR